MMPSVTPHSLAFSWLWHMLWLAPHQTCPCQQSSPTYTIIFAQGEHSTDWIQWWLDLHWSLLESSPTWHSTNCPVPSHSVPSGGLYYWGPVCPCMIYKLKITFLNGWGGGAEQKNSFVMWKWHHIQIAVPNKWSLISHGNLFMYLSMATFNLWQLSNSYDGYPMVLTA